MRRQIIRVIILGIIAALMVFFYVRSGGDFFGGGENGNNPPLGSGPIVQVRAPTQARPTLLVSGTPVACTETPFEAGSPPGAQASDITPLGWYRSLDGMLWGGPEGELHTGEIAFNWFNPQGGRISISGRRTDGQGPFLGVSAATDLGGGFQSDVLGFSQPGCWQVNARTEESDLSFIVLVH